MDPEYIHFNKRMNGISQQPLLHYSPDGKKMEEIFRKLKKEGKKVDAIAVTDLALEKGIDTKYLDACLTYIAEEEEDIYPVTRLKAVSIQQFLMQEFPPRENILDPIIPSQGLCEIFATRGIGKTHLGIGIACAVAAGCSFLRWQAHKPQGVLYVDGELPGVVLQSWFQEIIAGADKQLVAPLNIITPDFQEIGMPDISTPEGQEFIEECITDDFKLIILDNISTLVRSGKENAAESWQPVQSWLLKLRAAGKTVLFLHHANKSGGARGTSKREDVLDTVIRLTRPSNYTPEMGATFEVHFDKNRGIHGDDVKPFEVQYQIDKDGAAQWITRSLEDSNYLKVIKLHKEGLSQKEIAEEIGIHKSNVSRHVKKASENGDINDE